MSGLRPIVSRSPQADHGDHLAAPERRGGRSSGTVLAAVVVGMLATVGGTAGARGQSFEVPEPPSLELPDLPAPSSVPEPSPSSRPEPTQRQVPAPGPTIEPAPDPGPTIEPAPEGIDPASESPSPTVAALVEDFEGDRVSWRQETADAPIRMRAHERTSDGAFDGKSERFQFVAGLGSGVYVSYPLPKVPLADELSATVYVRSDRPGMQLLGRVVMPNDLDPETGQPFFVNVTGTIYEEAGRWRRLELGDLPTAVERQVRLLRIRSNQQIRMEGAYLDRLVLNLYGGAGETEILVDSLRVAPVDAELLRQSPGPRIGFASGGSPVEDEGPGEGETSGEGGGEDATEDTFAGGRVRFNRNRLELLDEPTRAFFPWVPTIIDAPGAAHEELRRFGFDVFAVRPGASAEEVNRAADAGFLLMPMLGDRLLGAADAARLQDAAGSYPRREAVAFWHLGDDLGGQDLAEDRRATLGRIREAAELASERPGGASPMTTGGVAGEHAMYASRPGRLDLIEAHGRPWGSTTEPLHYYNYLVQRRDLTGLANVEALFWTWIPVTAPPEVQRAIFGDDPPPPWGRPQVLPEQIRISTAAALSAGYRGVGYTADAELTRASGRARLIELQLLNAEIDLFQEILARNVGSIIPYKAFPSPDEETGRPIDRNYNRVDDAREEEVNRLHQIMAVGFPTPDKRGTLLLVSNLGWKAQWIPDQLAEEEVRVTVPGHTNVAAWEIGLGGVRNLDRERVPGGIEIRLTDFGVTSWVLLTPDTEMIRRLEQSIASWAPKAAELAIEQAELRLRSVTETHAQLVLDSFEVEGSKDLLESAQGQLEAARAGLARGEADKAFANARRVSRPLQILMRQHYYRAMEDLQEATEFAHDPDVEQIILPISSPPMMCFNTLPQQELFWTSTIRTYPFGRNLLPSGEFEQEDPDAYVREGWTAEGYEVPGLTGLIEIEPDELEDARGSRRLLRLRVRPAEGQDVTTLPPVQDRPTVAIRTPPIPVRRHEFLRISVLVRMPTFQAPGSGGGVVVRDSIGGELMQFRSFPALPEWRRVVLYRRVPEDGELTVLLGLAATAGEVYFDDLRVERAEQPGGAVPSPALGAVPIPEEGPSGGPEPMAPPALEPGRRASAGAPGVPRRERRR